MITLLSTKEAAKFLGVNEKMIYTLVSEKGLPATKITGKWLFPRHLIEQWLELNTINYPDPNSQLPKDQGLLIIAGSNDPLLEKAISLFNSIHSDYLAVFGNLGSMGGVKALLHNRCHMASSHLLQDDDTEYNFGFINSKPGKTPALINFCKREQGIVVKKGNPKKIFSFTDFAKTGVKIINRQMGTGTRLLLDKELQKKGISNGKIKGYENEVFKHLDVGLEVLAGRVDAGPCIKPIASLLNLEFVPIRWERYDLLITKENFFDRAVQLFKEMLNEKRFKDLVESIKGYDLSLSGKMLFPKE
ncbi:MAG: helix-turn-helix transcriptional regulator [Deltaproteobacteria bacterium]|nr:helix-turn-helix transcriptional regulator [Deltaproteobacteria bacterium]MBT4527281.1 helix-turn-helix transcriptional regulator [Deltaproteobacteria bacterium]